MKTTPNQLIKNLFGSKRGRKLYSVIATPEMLDCLEKHKPSGGWYHEYCMNSQFFKNRKCKQDGKKYKSGYKCPCFI